MHYEFLTDNSVLADPLRKWAIDDAAGAQLSHAFRTYYRLRPWVPLAVRQLLQRNRPVDALPRWYLPSALFAELDANLSEAGPITMIHPWPDGAEWSLVLTHDVETADGMRNVLRLAEIEQEFGFRSAWNLVPYLYKIDCGIMRELRDRGFEIGVHGYNHDGRLFESLRTFTHRAAAINRALGNFEAVGFRAPMVHRNLEWLQQLDIEYDASTFDVDPFQAMPGGVGGIWPLIAGKFVELPYTLPQDHTLLVVHKQTDGRIWREKLDFLIHRSGMALLVTHPDYLQTPYQLDMYRRFLADAQQRELCWHALPREVAHWWRERQASRVATDEAGRASIQGPAVQRGRIWRLNTKWRTHSAGALSDEQQAAAV
jgi:peptidoglycan/xylan/chitin deacetylase (PgdA/CDA1 family)